MRISASPAFSNRRTNPYNWLLYTEMMRLGAVVHEHSCRRLLAGPYDVWHLHWPESLLNERHTLRTAKAALKLLLMMDAARRRRIKIVWTVHNLAPHEDQHPRIAGWFWRAFIRRLDAYISLTTAGQKLVVERFPRLRSLPGFVIPHGHYRDVYSNPPTRASARERLHLEAGAPVVAFVGQLRPYKNVPALIRAFAGLNDDRATLLIAGESKDEALEREIRIGASTSRRVRLHVGFMPERDVERHVVAADLLVFPFRSILNSGSVILALSLDRPVLVPATLSMVELQGLVGADWVQTYEQDLTPDRLHDAISSSRRAVGRPALAPLAWRGIARQTLEAYKCVVGSPANTGHAPAVTSRLTAEQVP